MNPRFIRIQDMKTQCWHYLNVYHVASVTETTKPSSAPHWNSSNSGEVYATIKMANGTQYETDTYPIAQIIQRLTKENTEWARVVDKLDLLAP